MKRRNKPKVTSTANSTFTPDQLRQLFFAQCLDRDHLYEWIKLFWGVNLPGKVVSRYSSCNPLDSVWDVYNHCVHLKQGMDTLYIAPRGGGKTLGVAIAESALMFHDKRGVVHVGAIEKQSKRAYQYFQNFIAKNKDVLSPLVEKDTIEKTVLVVDNEQVSLECLPCTMAALNGPHEACIVMDELDTLSPEGRLAYKQINGIPVKHRLTGAPPVKIGISTRKSSYGLVQQQMDTAEEQGRTVKMWNQIDLMERCDVTRHGMVEVDIYVNQERMHHVPKDEYDKLADSKKNDYVLHKGTSGCLKCPLFSVCLGDAKKQDPKMTAASSTMIATIDDVIKKVRSADADWVMAELMCMKPSVEGIVFKEFDKTRHVVDFNFMWKVLTKEEPTVDIDENAFVREIHRRQIPVYAGIDWGWTAPSTLTVAAVDPEDNVYVLRSFGITKTNDPTFIHMIKTKYHKYYRVQMYYPDNANGSGIDLMKTAGLPVAKVDKSENLGVQVIKRLLNTPGTAETKLHIARGNCDQLIHEMERYHYEKDASGTTIDGKFAAEYDHSIDGLRYMLVAIMGKARFVISHDMMGSKEAESPLLAADGAFLRAPNFYELARQHNIPINAPESKPFNRPDDDEDVGPDGFTWGF
jgi:hypothetical protein